MHTRRDFPQFANAIGMERGENLPDATVKTADHAECRLDESFPSAEVRVRTSAVEENGKDEEDELGESPAFGRQRRAGVVQKQPDLVAFLAPAARDLHQVLHRRQVLHKVLAQQTLHRAFLLVTHVVVQTASLDVRLGNAYAQTKKSESVQVRRSWTDVSQGIISGRSKATLKGGLSAFADLRAHEQSKRACNLVHACATSMT